MHPQTLWHAFWHTHARTHTHAGIRVRAHTPHGAGNMSEQSGVWHVNQSLLLEVWRDSAGEDSLRGRAPWKRFRFLAMKVKETCKFLEPRLVHDERLYCATLYFYVYLFIFFSLHVFTLGHVAFGRVLRSQRQSPSWDFPTATVLSLTLTHQGKDGDSPVVRSRQNGSRRGSKTHLLSGCYGNVCKHT